MLYDATQNYGSYYNNSGANKTTNTRFTTSFVIPTQTNRHKYSYYITLIESTTIIKTTYSWVVAAK